MVEDLRPIMGPKMEVLRDDVAQWAKNGKIVCVPGGCTIATKTKINVFIFFLSSGRFEAAPFEKFQKTLILAFEANSALSPENDTKIVQTAHSDPGG